MKHSFKVKQVFIGCNHIFTPFNSRTVAKFLEYNKVCEFISSFEKMNGNVMTVDNYIAAEFVPPSTGEYVEVANPADFHTVGKVGVSSAADVNDAVAAAELAFPEWSSKTIKARATIVRDTMWFDFLFCRASDCEGLNSKSLVFVFGFQMMKFHSLVKENAQELAELIVKENGKNITEALADGK